MERLSSLRRFNESEIAQQRMKIINFYEKYEEKATKEAFGADRKLISRWRKRLTRPHKRRKQIAPKEIVDFIREMREKYACIGKEKLKPLLDKYCKDKGLKTVSESIIGNLIKRHKFFYQKTGRYILTLILNG